MPQTDVEPAFAAVTAAENARVASSDAPAARDGVRVANAHATLALPNVSVTLTRRTTGVSTVGSDVPVVRVPVTTNAALPGVDDPLPRLMTLCVQSGGTLLVASTALASTEFSHMCAFTVEVLGAYCPPAAASVAAAPRRAAVQCCSALVPSRAAVTDCARVHGADSAHATAAAAGVVGRGAGSCPVARFKAADAPAEVEKGGTTELIAKPSASVHPMDVIANGVMHASPVRGKTETTPLEGGAWAYRTGAKPVAATRPGKTSVAMTRLPVAGAIPESDGGAGQVTGAEKYHVAVRESTAVASYA